MRIVPGPVLEWIITSAGSFAIHQVDQGIVDHLRRVREQLERLFREGQS